MNYRTFDEAIAAAQAMNDGSGMHVLRVTVYRIAPTNEVPDLQAQGYEGVATITRRGNPLYWIDLHGPVPE